MPTFPPDLYPYLVATLFQGQVPMGHSSSWSDQYAYSVAREETRQCHHPDSACITCLAATCRAIRRAVKNAHTQDAHAAVLRWWRTVLDSELRLGQPPQHASVGTQRTIFAESGQLHRSTFDLAIVIYTDKRSLLPFLLTPTLAGSGFPLHSGTRTTHCVSFRQAKNYTRHLSCGSTATARS
jgi:hypothetical protein